MKEKSNLGGTQNPIFDPETLVAGPRDFSISRALQQKAHGIIPGGGHTYAKGDDQFPENAPGFIARGKGCHVWDVDGNEFVEYGMGLRAVTLGHAFEPVGEAAYRQMTLGINFSRPAKIELDLAEAMLGVGRRGRHGEICQERLRCNDRRCKSWHGHLLGRDLIAICRDQPFFSTDDWFIGTTEMNAGIPQAVIDLTLKFRYDPALRTCGSYSTSTSRPNRLRFDGGRGGYSSCSRPFLKAVKELCEQRGALLIFDEMITGFRWHLGGAQKFHNVVPHLSTFGKAMGNGFAIAGLAGKREIMRLGGLDHNEKRVFLLSTTHGAETHALAASLETIRIYRERSVVEYLWKQGERLSALVNRSIAENRLEGFFQLLGRPCNLLFETCDQDQNRSQAFRTLFMQELIQRGVIAPSFVVSFSHTDADIDRTAEAVYEAHVVYRKALDEGVEKYLEGRPVKPVNRKYS